MIPDHDLKILKILHTKARGRHPYKEAADKYHEMTGRKYDPHQIARDLNKHN